MTTNERGYDDVTSGVIVGGNSIPYAIFYDNRQQGQREYAESEENAIEAGKNAIAQLKHEYCGYPYYLYHDVSKWEIRIYS